MRNIKYGTNELIQKTKTHTHIKNKFVVAKGQGQRETDGLAVWAWQMQCITFRMDKQKGPAVQHRELCSRSCDKPYGKDIK